MIYSDLAIRLELKGYLEEKRKTVQFKDGVFSWDSVSKYQAIY
jgi:hypothetical protein